MPVHCLSYHHLCQVDVLLRFLCLAVLNFTVCVYIQQCIESAPLFPIVSDDADTSQQTGSSPHASNEPQSSAVKTESTDTQAESSREPEPQPGLVIVFSNTHCNCL